MSTKAVLPGLMQELHAVSYSKTRLSKRHKPVLAAANVAALQLKTCPRCKQVAVKFLGLCTLQAGAGGAY